jgi:hypothetical protein
MSAADWTTFGRALGTGAFKNLQKLEVLSVSDNRLSFSGSFFVPIMM